MAPAATPTNATFLSATPSQQAISKILKRAITAGHLSDTSPVAIFYDLPSLRANAHALISAFPPSSLHAFALKASPLVPLVRELAACGLGGECASVAELAVCRAAGLPGARVIFDSPAKTDAHLRRALSDGVHINADNFAELAQIARLSGELRVTPSVGLRVNPQLGEATIAETFTAAAACKFGEPLRERREAIVEAYVRYPFLTTVHVHVGSQGCAMEVLVAGAKAATELAEEVNGRVEGRVRMIDIGGGLSTEYWGDEEATSFEEFGLRLREEVPGLFGFRVLTEFGRRVAAKTAFIAARVQHVKRAGGRTYVVCHAGADLLVRPVYQAGKWGHRVEVYGDAGGWKTGERETVDVAGPLCFAGDIIAREREVAKAEAGDVVVVRDAGAYTMAMCCRHTSQLVPPVYGVEEDGQVTLLKRGETEEDVVRFWGG